MRRKLFFCALMFCASSLFSQNATPFNSSGAQNQATGIYSTTLPQFGASQNGFEYKPFATSGGQESLANGPILYGPGGDPIGGLPVKNGTQILFLVVLAYTLFKSIQIRIKRAKKLTPKSSI